MGATPAVPRGLLTEAASLDAEPRLEHARALVLAVPGLQRAGSVVVHKLSCSTGTWHLPKVKVTQWCSVLCDSIDCSPPGNQTHGRRFLTEPTGKPW